MSKFLSKKNLTFIIENKIFWDFGKFWTKILKSKSRWQRSLEMAVCRFHVIFRTKNWFFKGQTQICITRMTLKKSKNDFRDFWLCQIWSVSGSKCPTSQLLCFLWTDKVCQLCQVVISPLGCPNCHLAPSNASGFYIYLRLNLIKLVKLESFWYFWGLINGHLPDSCPMGWLFWAKIHTFPCKS